MQQSARQRQLHKIATELAAAEQKLQGAISELPSLNPARRALGRLARAMSRPLRIAILGESNSGKSSIANVLTGSATLPALPVANTRLPTLLRYAPVPRVEAVRASGERLAVGASSRLDAGSIIRLEVGLPVDRLRHTELLDFPGSSDPLFGVQISTALKHHVDTAIWATIATQAWRETERAAWMTLPARMRRQGLLVVTHIDLLAAEDDFRKLRARLKPIGESHFSNFCFLSTPRALGKSDGTPLSISIAESGASDLFALVDKLSDEFQMKRLVKAAELARRIAGRALAHIENL